MKHLILLILASGLTAEEQRLLKIAHWMGVPTKTISIDRESALEWPFPAGAGGPQCCVAMTAETLTLMRETSPRGLERLVQEGGAQLLVFDCGASTRHDSALSWLTKGAVAGVSARAHSDPVVHLPDGGREFTRQLANMPWKSREFVVKDCEGRLLAFGANLMNPTIP